MALQRRREVDAMVAQNPNVFPNYSAYIDACLQRPSVRTLIKVCKTLFESFTLQDLMIHARHLERPPPEFENADWPSRWPERGLLIGFPNFLYPL